MKSNKHLPTLWKLYGHSHFRSSRSEVFYKKGVLRNFDLVQVFSTEFCEISKNYFSYRTPPVAASVTGIYMKIRSNDHAVYVVMWCKPHFPI